MFRFCIPTRIVFGDGVMDALGTEVKQQISGSVLLVTDPGLIATGLVDRAGASLTAAGVAFDIFSDVPSDPAVDVIDAGVERYRAKGAQGVVCVGGGSAIDVGKAIALVGSLGGRIMDYKGAPDLSARPAPVFAVPTTAGTGSEVTGVLVMIDTVNRLKFVVKHPYLMPTAAILDPSVLLTLPARLKASTTMDALTHSMEALVSANGNAMTRAMAMESIRLILLNLDRFVHEPDVSTAGSILAASTMAGVAFTHAGLGAVHAVSHPVGGVVGVPHGEANAILLPHILRLNLNESTRTTYADILRMIDAPGEPEHLVAIVEQLNASIGIARDFAAYTADSDDIETMVAQIMVNPNMALNPERLTEQRIRQLLADLF